MGFNGARASTGQKDAKHKTERDTKMKSTGKDFRPGTEIIKDSPKNLRTLKPMISGGK